MIFAVPSEVEKKYPIPAAFETYTDYIEIKLGQEKFDQEDVYKRQILQFPMKKMESQKQLKNLS